MNRPVPKVSIPTTISIRGRARLRLDGKTFFLGRFGSPDARRLEDRVIGSYLAKGRTLPADFSLAGDQPATPAPHSTPAPAPQAEPVP